ncbi:MAG: hypothetical protein ACK559_23805, partial [bacterium]
NARKVFKRLRRIRGKYLSVDGDYVKSGLLAGEKSSPYARKVFKRIRRMRGQDLCVNGEDAKRLLAYSPNTPRDLKV